MAKRCCQDLVLFLELFCNDVANFIEHFIDSRKTILKSEIGIWYVYIFVWKKLVQDEGDFFLGVLIGSQINYVAVIGTVHYVNMIIFLVIS